MKEKVLHQILSIKNADKIGFIGDSYTESHFSIEGKAYICKLSLFSDYNYENFAQSGDTYRGNLDRIRKRSPIYHNYLSWCDMKPKYAVLVSYTNDLKYMDEEQYLNDLRAILETVKGLGAIPIIATEYHTNFGAGIEIALRQIADEYDCEFINIIDDVREVRGIDYTPFWSGTHPGTRTNHLLADHFESYLERLPRPRQSLKIFRLRDTYRNLEELIFNTNEERAKLFTEINVGHNCLTDVRYVDDVVGAKHEPITSEYLMLQNEEKVAFKDIALISAVLPSTSLGLKYIALNLGDVDVEVYVKDILKEPYPSPDFYQRFDIKGNHGIKVGDTYISDNPKFKDITFIVKEITGEAILALPYPRIDTNISGKLIKVKGEGNDSVPYSYTSIGFSRDYPKGKAKIGHYVKLNKMDDRYILSKQLIDVAVDYDKLHFIVVKPGKFYLNRVEIEWKGIENKVYISKSWCNKTAKGPKLLEISFANTEDAYTPVDFCLPEGSLRCIDISDYKALTQTINYSIQYKMREAQVVVWARYFPEIFNPNDDYRNCKITKDSYDYAQVCVDMIYENKIYTQTKRVGLHWKKVVFNIILPAFTDKVKLKVYSKEHAIQVAKVSMTEL